MRIAAGVAAGLGLVALAGANLRGSPAEVAPAAEATRRPAAAAPAEAAAPAPLERGGPASAAAPGPALAGSQKAAAAAGAESWRSRAAAPHEVVPGVLARVAARQAHERSACDPGAGEGSAPGAAARNGPGGEPRRCTPPIVSEPIQIEWNAPPANP